MTNPPRYLSLGRYEDLVDIERVDIVNIHMDEQVDVKRDIFIPVDSDVEVGNCRATIYNLTKEYEITKQGLRRWKKDGGRIKAYYFPKGTILDEAYVDDFEENAAIVFA